MRPSRFRKRKVTFHGGHWSTAHPAACSMKKQLSRLSGPHVGGSAPNANGLCCCVFSFQDFISCPSSPSSSAWCSTPPPPRTQPRTPACTSSSATPRDLLWTYQPQLRWSLRSRTPVWARRPKRSPTSVWPRMRPSLPLRTTQWPHVCPSSLYCTQRKVFIRCGLHRGLQGSKAESLQKARANCHWRHRL